MATRDEDEIWRSIVENYGERAVIDDRPAAEGRPAAREAEQDTAEIDPHRPRPPRPSTPTGEDVFGPAPRPTSTPFTGSTERHPEADEGPDAPPDQDVDELLDDEHRFVAPVPPLPRMDRNRWIAWLAVLGSPTAFVLAAILNQNLSGFVALVLALAFVGGFGWLVLHMPQEPRDPWDDGARV